MRHRLIVLALLLLAVCAAPATAQVVPWFGTDPGPFGIFYAHAYEVPALLHTLEQRCYFVTGMIPGETVTSQECREVAGPGDTPPGGWGCHKEPVPLCIDPPATHQVCETRSVTDEVIVYARRQSPLDVHCPAGSDVPK